MAKHFRQSNQPSHSAVPTSQGRHFQGSVQPRRSAAHFSSGYGTQTQDRPATAPTHDFFDESRAEDWNLPQGEPNHPQAAPRKRRHPGRVALVVVLVLLAALYAGGAWYFGGHFLPNTAIAGTDVSLQDPGAATDRLGSDLATYRLSVTDPQGAHLLDVDAADVSLRCDAAKAVEDALDGQDALLWPVRLAQRLQRPTAVSLPSIATYDERALSQLVQDGVAQANQGRTQPTDATIAYDAASGSFEVQAERSGTMLDADAVADEVGGALATLDASVTLDDAAYEQPQVLSSDPRLVQAAAEADALLGAQVTVTMDGQVVATPQDQVAAQWVALDDDLVPHITQESIAHWAASRYDTVGTTRTYTRADGKQCTVTGGSYGRDVDQDTFASEALPVVEEKGAATIDLPVTQEADVDAQPGERDWGARYLDADISEQHARLYDDSGALVWESDFVSGNESTGDGTPRGVYTILNKYNSITLVGEDQSENFVYNWMGFIGTTWGLHDATWRDQFGGTIYQTNGSHGCLNLPLDAADELYDLLRVGDVIVIHE